MINKDRPFTWIKYESKMCQTCQASCCTMPVEIKAADLLRLGVVTQDEVERSLKKVAKKLKKEGVISSYREATDLFILTQKSNDDCYFLDSKTRRCTVYEKRPDTCRDFPLKVGPRVTYCPYTKVPVPFS